MQQQNIDRLDLAQLSGDEIAPLERCFSDEWTDPWRDLARSLYITLLSAADPVDQGDLGALAQQARQLTMGIVEDLGGTQMYIAAGRSLLASARSQRIVALLQQGTGYDRIAASMGVTERYVRRIHAQWRAQQRELRQTQLFD